MVVVGWHISKDFEIRLNFHHSWIFCCCYWFKKKILFLVFGCKFFKSKFCAMGNYWERTAGRKRNLKNKLLNIPYRPNIKIFSSYKFDFWTFSLKYLLSSALNRNGKYLRRNNQTAPRNDSDAVSSPSQPPRHIWRHDTSMRMAKRRTSWKVNH